MARALGDDVRELGFGELVADFRNDTQQQLEPHIGIKNACDLTGVSRATLHRKRNPKPKSEEPLPRPEPRNKLTPAECDEIIAALNSEPFRDKSPRQAWAALLDQGVYLASPSTFYRVLRSRGLVRERRAQATHPPKKIPHLEARKPNDVWTWDITKLRGPRRGEFYDLYVMLDIFSRCAVHWEIHDTETGELAEQFIENAIRVNGGIAPLNLHADRGTSMTSKAVVDLLSDLGITRTHSRPKISNDNPYSEAAFKTLKYCPVFPGEFGSIQDAKKFCRRFFDYYNHDHYHSGIGLHTPFSLHIGTAYAIQDQRALTIEKFRAANPDRFTRRPSLPKIPTVAWINPIDSHASSTDQHDQEKQAV
jgi:putative transposase